MSRPRLRASIVVLSCAAGCPTNEYNDFGEPAVTTTPSDSTTGETSTSTRSATTSVTTESPTSESTSGTPTTSSDVDDSSESTVAGTTDGSSGGDEPAATIVLNELSSSDEDPPYDPEVDAEEYGFPDGTSVGPGEVLVVLGGKGRDLHLFGLSGGGDYVTLFTPDLFPADFIGYEDGEATVSYCRVPDGGEWTSGCAATPGSPNAAE